MSKHLKRLFSPKTWKVKKKEMKYITKPSPGAHRVDESLPLNVVLRDLIGYANNNREVKYMLHRKEVLVDGKRKWDYRSPVGIFDVLSLDGKEHFRMALDKKGKIVPIKAAKGEEKVKVCKVMGKKKVKSGKLQLNLNDGKNLLVDKDNYKTGDTVIIEFGDKLKIKDHIKLEKNSLIFLTGGRHIGQMGKVQDMAHNRIIYKTEDGDVVETLRKYAFAIGKDKPVIKIAEK